jgi:hypothetical protein
MIAMARAASEGVKLSQSDEPEAKVKESGEDEQSEELSKASAAPLTP